MVIVNTKNGKAFRGILWHCGWFSEFIMLKKADFVQAGSNPMPVDGELILFKREIDFIQVLR